MDVRKNIQIKGLHDFLAEDGSLTEKIPFEDFEKKAAIPKNSDKPLPDAYESYLNILEKL